MPRPGQFGPNVVPLKSSRSRPELIPIGRLTKEERKTFDHTVREYHHLKRGDIPMLELFAKAYCLAAASAKGKNPQAWERHNRIVMAYLTKLRLTPQAQMEPRTAARRRADANRSSFLDNIEEE